MKKIIFCLFLAFLPVLSFSYRFIITPYFFYQSHLYFEGSDRYNESYPGFGVEGSYRINSFLMASIIGETASLHSVNKKVSAEYENDFPEEKVERSYNLLGGKLEFFWMTNPENMFYTGLGISHVWQSALIELGVEYPESKRSEFLYQFFLGDRFLLYPDIIFNLEVAFASSFEKTYPPLNESGKFSNYWIHLRLGVGYLF